MEAKAVSGVCRKPAIGPAPPESKTTACFDSSARELGRSFGSREGNQIFVARNESQVAEVFFQKNSDHLIVVRKRGNSRGAKRVTASGRWFPLPTDLRRRINCG